VERVFPHFLLSKRWIWGGFGGRRRRLAGALVGEEEGKKGRGGEKGLPRAQYIGLVAPARMARQACRASACGATGSATSAPLWRSASSGRQRGHPVAPHAVAWQRLAVAPGQVARPNGLWGANKIWYRLNLKYYLKRIKKSSASRWPCRGRRPAMAPRDHACRRACTTATPTSTRHSSSGATSTAV